jgi:hypothetical protein
MKLSEDEVRRLGYVCTECGKVNTSLRACPKGCTKICRYCLSARGRKFVFCKECGDMTLVTWKATV